MSSVASPFTLLDDDALGCILDRLRRDPLGNETVPSHVCENLCWRPVCKRFKAVSISFPSEFNGTVTCAEEHHSVEGIIDSYSGGKRFTRLPSAIDDEEAKWQHCFQLHIVRVPRTGRLFCLTSIVDIGDPQVSSFPKQRRHIIDLPQLTACLSGHTAEIDDRIGFFQHVVVFGKEVKGSMVLRTNRSIAADYYYRAGRILGSVPERTQHLTVSFAPGVRDRNGKEHEVITPELRITGAWGINIPVQLTDAQPGETLETIRTEDDAKRKTVPSLSVALGYYEPAEVAERGGWLVSTHRKHLAAPSLLVKPTLADPERGLRDRANLAIQQAANEKLRRAQAQERARQRAAEANALVPYQRRSPVEEAEDRRKRAIVLRGGPAASMMAKPRACTRRTQKRMREDVRNLNSTHLSGRKHAITQPQDELDVELAGGPIDDQYANKYDHESDSEDTSDDEDRSYVPKPSRQNVPRGPDIVRRRTIHTNSSSSSVAASSSSAPVPATASAPMQLALASPINPVVRALFMRNLVIREPDDSDEDFDL